MNKIKKVLEQNNINTKKYTIKNNVYIIDDKYVVKKNNINNNELYNYLISRSFDYFPKKIINNNREDYDIYEYINDTPSPCEQKAEDIINLISMLHAKTTFYKSVTKDSFKEIYENIKIELDKTKEFYNNLFNIINEEIYMPPSKYLLIRNISKVFASIDYCYTKLEEYLEITSEINKQRFCTIHNNLKLDHLIKNEKSYLISWDNSKIDIPIYDLYNFYNNNYLELDFSTLLTQYKKKYSILLEEELLFMILISIPKTFKFESDEYKNVIIVNNSLEYLFKSEKLVSFLNNFKEIKEEIV